jgi:DsbC/DsbD-like thiol-disulfide interchange protein
LTTLPKAQPHTAKWPRARWRRAPLAFGAVVLAILAASANALPQAPAESHAKLELLANKSAGSSSTTWVGVLFRMDPGWHIYWQNAGDSGEPPKIRWSGLPASDRVGEIQWPTPVRLGSGSVIDYGYEGQVLLMAPIHSAPGTPPDAPQHIAADVRYVVCREICIPGNAQLHVAADGNVAQTAQLFAQTRKELPQKAPTAWHVSAAQNKDSIVLTVKTGGNLTSAKFFPLDADIIENSAPQAFAQVAGGFRLTLKKSQQLVKPVDHLRGLISMGSGRSFEVNAPVAAIEGGGGATHSK